jgi:hypothetical protein
MFPFRHEKLQYSALVCDIPYTEFEGNDTVDNRAIKFIEEVNINIIPIAELQIRCCGNFENLCTYMRQYLHAYFRSVSTSS